MRCISVLNQKGGVGKTTTVANLGAALAELDKRVLLADMDPQANLSIHYGVELERGEPSVYSLITEDDAAEDVRHETMMDGVDLLPSNIDLAGLEVELSGLGGGREKKLRRAVRGLQEDYDYFIIDCPPSLGLLTLNAMCATSEAFIPLQTEFFALQGLGRLLGTVRLVRSGPNPDFEITGIIASMFDVRTSLAVDVLDDIRDHFGEKVFDTVIRNNIRLAEAPGYGKPIMLYDKRCYGCEDYRSLAREVVAMEDGKVDVPADEDSTPPLPGEEDVPRAKAG